MNSEEAKIRMAEGRIYQPGDEGILKEQFVCMEKLYDFNATRPSEQKKRQDMLKDMFAAIGANCYIEPPLHANFGGKHVHFGRNVYANYNLTLVDDGHIYVGDYVMIGPNVTISTAGHPVEPHLRRQGLQYNICLLYTSLAQRPLPAPPQSGCVPMPDCHIQTQCWG